MPVYQPYEVLAVPSRAASVAVADVNGDDRGDVIVSTSSSGDAEHDFKLFLFTQSATMSASSDPVRSKGDLTYTVQVTNSGPGDSSAVTLARTLPVGTTIVSVQPSAGTCTVAAVSCALGPLPSGSSATVTVAVKVTAKPRTVLTSQAQVSGPRPDPNTANNTASHSTTVR